MNKYDFDFRRVEDVLHDTLGIANPTDIIALKMQIRESLNLLSESIEKKALGKSSEDKIQAQKNMLYKELEAIAEETDLETVLRKCIEIRRFSLLGLEEKVRPDDSHEVRAEKQSRKNEIFAVYELIKSVDYIVELMNERAKVLKYVDDSKRVIRFDKVLPEVDPENADNPVMKLDIRFQPRPDGFPDEYAECLQEAGIYAYNFGDLICLDEPNLDGEYTREVTRKKMVGVIKKDEFGEIKEYTVLMNDEFEDVPPEFYRDILFSDMLLRNAKNNYNFLGVPKPLTSDTEYGFKVGFDEPGLAELMRAISFENKPDVVKIDTNFERATSASKACEVMKEKMDQAVRELENSGEKTKEESDDSEKTLGDD